MTVKSTLIEALNKVSSGFEKNELAYLSLTSKMEIQVRDKLSFILYKELLGKYIVSREWKRVDLAILKNDNVNNEPVALIELKAMYTGDFFTTKTWKHFQKAMKKDLGSATKKWPGVPIYNLLLATNPLSKLPATNGSYLKYPRRANKILKKGRSIADCKKGAKQVFTGIEPSHGIIEAGEAFGIKTEILYWLYEHQ